MSAVALSTRTGRAEWSRIWSVRSSRVLVLVTATADHTTGAIVPTLQWTPRRGVLLAARAFVITATATLVGLLLVTAACVVVWALVPEVGLPVAQGRDLLAGLSAVYGSCALLGVGLGLALRSTAGGLVTVLALVLVLPPLLAQLPYDWSATLTAILPGSSVLHLVFGEGPREGLSPASSRLVLAAWAAGALLVGGARLVRSDATR
ncbi:hypothetical protein GCM10023168_07870 [Fodinibacter luteus]|uniref:ABC transporter permease n=1 Tax=Fodinibacter luteus TaxID=552064 RepID=A0ABP8K3Z5_9MICO